MSDLIKKEAEALRVRAIALGDLLAEKCVAYGGAHNRQADLWRVLLRPYEAGPGEYLIPVELVFHIPRLTRVLDRVLRIVANPATDPMREDPWTDLAGDALAGVVMPKSGHCSEYPECELADGHPGLHAKVDAAGLHSWADETPDIGGGTLCGAHFHHSRELRTCARRKSHEGPHVDERGLADPAHLERALGGMERPRGFVAEEEEKKASVCGAQFQTLVGTRECALAEGHEGSHRCAGGLEESGRA